MNQIKLFIQQKNIVINNLSLNFNDIKDIKEKTIQHITAYYVSDDDIMCQYAS